MKKKLFAVLGSAFLSVALCGALTACGETTETKTGEYSYANSWNTATSYGVKVTVTLKGETIQSVTIDDSNYIEASDSNTAYGWDNSVWYDGKEAFLASFEGMTISDLESVNVTVSADGQPGAVSGMDVVTGATQCSGRVILAVKNALGLSTSATFTGEYSYANIYDPSSSYGIKVSVTVDGGKIVEVSVVDSNYIEASDSNTAYGWDNSVWYNGVDAYLASFEGMNVVDLASVEVEVNSAGQPSSVSGMSVVTGSTQSSGRLILAIQDALGVQNKVVAATGTAYGLVHGGSYVGKSTVSVRGEEIIDVTLNEVCFPTYVKADDSVSAEDKVDSYYKTVSFGSFTFTYDETAGTYVCDGETFAEVMADEDNAGVYFEAVMDDEVYVTVGGEERNDILCKATLCKEDNGYWTNSVGLQWIPNRDATVNYVLENGVDNLLALVKGDDGYWTDGEVSTGATWTDLNSDPTGYLSYAQLILNAYDAAVGN